MRLSFPLGLTLLAAVAVPFAPARAQGELTGRNVAVLVGGSYARAFDARPSGGGLNAYAASAGLVVGQVGLGANYSVAEAGEYDHVRAGGGSVSFYLARQGVTGTEGGSVEVVAGLATSEIGSTFNPALIVSRRIVERPEVVLVPQGSVQRLVPLNEKNVSGRESVTVLSVGFAVGLGAPDSRVVVAPTASYALGQAEGGFGVGVSAGLVFAP